MFLTAESATSIHFSKVGLCAHQASCPRIPFHGNGCCVTIKQPYRIPKKAWKLVIEYQSNNYTGDVWVDQAIGYVRFARQEPHLFKCLLNGRNLELRFEMHKWHWQYLAECLKGYEAFNGLDEELLSRIRYSRAMLSHGVATSPNTGLNKIIVENDDLLAGYLRMVSQALLKGHETLPPLEEDKKQLIESARNQYGDNR